MSASNRGGRGFWVRTAYVRSIGGFAASSTSERELVGRMLVYLWDCLGFQ